jgi:alcohol dehydrogenase
MLEYVNRACILLSMERPGRMSAANLLSRFRVRLNAAVLPYLNIPVPLTLVGPGSALTLSRLIGRGGCRRVMLVTDKPLVKLGLLAPMIAEMTDAGVTVEVFDEVEPDPGYDLVVRGVERLKSIRADAVLAVGGGSPLDCAKAIVLSHANRCHPSRLAGLWLYALPRRRGLPFYAVPTTAGTGSEVSMVSIISDHQAQAKRVIVDPKLLPGMVALDPELTLGLPKAITAATGIDALTHAVEAYISTTATAQTDEWALSAARMILVDLPTVYADGANISARESMLLASCLAGLAFTRAGVGYVHAFAHQMGARYHLPHGVLNAILMPHILEHAKADCAPRLAALARAAGLQSASENDGGLADAFIGHLRHLNVAMAIPSGIDQLRSADFDAIIDHAFAEAHGTYGVPRYFTRQEARAMLGRLLVQPSNL